MKTLKVKCPRCGKEKEDAPRAEWDPEDATLIVVPCPDCSVGCKIEGGTYWNEEGKEVS